MTAVTSVITRQATFKPATLNSENRTVELVWSTGARVLRQSWFDDPFYEELSLSDDAVDLSRLNAGASLLNNHNANQLADVVGVVERAWIANREALARVRFSSRPDVDGIWRDVQDGIIRNVSVGYTVQNWERSQGKGDPHPTLTATRWLPMELSLVGIPADAGAQVRNNPTAQNQMTTTNPSTTVTITPDPSTPSVAELEAKVLRLENEQLIRATAERAGLESAATDEIVEAHVADTDDALQAIVARLAARQPRFNSMAVDASGGADDDLTGLIGRKLKGERGLAPLSVILRDELRIAESNPTQIVQRAMATADFPQALIEAGERELLDAYNRADEGLRALALRRELMDFRQIKLMRVSKYGAVGLVPEGAEYATSTFCEEDGVSLQAAQYGSLMKVTRVALANDDLDVFGRMVIEMGGAAARREAEELELRLDDITWTAANSLTGQTNLDVDAIAAGVLLLRRQTDVNGNKVSFTPNTLVIAPEQEKVSRQMLASYQPNTAANVNPFSTLRLEVDHNLADGIAYLADTSYMPLAIGQVGVGPSISEEEEFSTGSLQLRVQHDFGTCAVDGRSIVRIAL